MTTQSITSITDGQRKQYKRFVEDAADKVLAEARIDKDGLQKLIENGDEFQSRIMTAVRELSVSNQFANEEVESNCGYISGYRKPKGITEQCNILRQIFPGVGNALEKLAEREVPLHAEGWFAIPKWQTIAPTYSEAVVKVLDAIREARGGKLHNYREGQINDSRLRQTAKTVSVFDMLGDEQKGHDILVVAGQFGLHHRGRSVRRAREVFQTNESGLGAFAIGIMLLIHAERLQHYDDLWIDCAGDEYDDPAAAVRFDLAPYFHFIVGRVRFGTVWFVLASAFYGSASVFVPQN